MNVKLLSSIMLSAALSSSWVISSAQQLDEVVVKFDGQSISSPAGAKKLYHRIHSAAERSCQSLDTTTLFLRFIFKGCVAKAVKDAVTQVNSPALFEILIARGDAGTSNVPLSQSAR